MGTHASAAAAAALAVLVPLAARAQEEPPDVAHDPIAETPRGLPLRLFAQVASAWRVRALTAVWRRPGEPFHQAAFGKAADGSWAAIIDGAEVRGPLLE